MDEATLKETLRQYSSKTRYFCPKKNEARPHFLTVFSPYSLRQAREPPSGPASMFEQGELRSRREERNLNGVKNLLGAKPSPNTLIKESRIWRYFRR